MKCLSITPLPKPIEAEVAIPGSKSYTNRALILAALVKGLVKISNPLFSDDTVAMMECLKTLGIKSIYKDGILKVDGGIDSIADKEYDLDVNMSGTTIRFILALSAIIPGIQTIKGRGRLNERPVGDLVDALRHLGAKIEYTEKEGFPPVRVSSSKLSPGTVRMNGEVSSQFLSAVLMIAPIVGDLTIEVIGRQISKPYIDMTIDTMKKFGVSVIEVDDSKYVIHAGQKYEAKDYLVEGDVSSASYFFAIAALTASRITLKNMNPKSMQADMGFLRILEQMGSVATYGEHEIILEGRGTKPVTVDMQDCPDQVQTLAAISAATPGVTKISGVGSLRVKETERVAALERELAKMGIKTESTPETMTIHGGNPRPAVIDTYWDHRMAMAFAVLGTKIPGMEIRNPGVVSKTYPNFWETLNSIGIKTEIKERDPNIVLIGMKGSGKTTVSRLLSKRLNKEYLDLDELVQKKAGKTIADIVKEKGWEHFRDLETQMVREVSARDGAVISTGGGIVTRQENIEAIKRNGLCIFLRASIDTLVSRMEEDDAHRPPLTTAATPKDELEILLAERAGLYEAAADETIDTGSAAPEIPVADIMQKLRARGIIEK